MKALPEPDFRYFSKLKAVYLLEKAKYEMRVMGNLSFVAETLPFSCRMILSLRFSQHPRYDFLSEQFNIYT